MTAAPSQPFARPPVPLLTGPLPLDRHEVDRDAQHRSDPALLERLWADPGTRVVLVDGAQVATADGALALLAPEQVPALGLAGHEAFYLGRAGEVGYLAVTPATGELAGDDLAHLGLTLSSLRDVGHLFDAAHAGLATTAVALAQWRRGHRHCPRCGEATQLRESGWSARCPADGSQHFPRTDPAVIMAVHDGAGRLLLARSVAWPQNRRSVLAGFVEAGESPESAVRREVAEEVGVRIGRVEYAGSQPWPFPASLMLGYHAWAVDSAAVAALRPDGEEITHADWFTREELRVALAEDRVRLPMQTSIALALIESWYGETLPSAP